MASTSFFSAKFNMGSFVSNLFTGNAQKKAARQQAEAERQAALENVTVTAQGEEAPQNETATAQSEAENAAQNKRSRRRSYESTVLSSLLSGKRTLG